MKLLSVSLRRRVGQKQQQQIRQMMRARHDCVLESFKQTEEGTLGWTCLTQTPVPLLGDDVLLYPQAPQIKNWPHLWEKMVSMHL